MPEGIAFEHLKLLYQENAKIAAIFWEWRNKIITDFSAAIVALFTLAGWLHQHSSGWLVSVPLFTGSILCVILTYLDARNADILQACYVCGAEIETQLLRADGLDRPSNIEHSIFELIGQSHSKGQPPPHGKGVTYTRILRFTFISFAILLALLGIANLSKLFTL